MSQKSNSMTDEAEPTLAGLQRQLLQVQIDELKKTTGDHENRIRPVEDVATKFNFILYLTMGGGLVSLFTLATVVFGVIAVILGLPTK